MDWLGIVGGLGIGGLLGTTGTQWAIGRREKVARRIAFKKQQLEEFYGPLLAAHKEILARGELRLKLQQALDDPHPLDGVDAHVRIVDTNVEDENETFRELIMPRYREMISIFRDKMWLAEPETRGYFIQLIEFVDVWDKILDKKLPNWIAPRIKHTEENLAHFYRHLEEVHDRLRREVS